MGKFLKLRIVIIHSMFIRILIRFLLLELKPFLVYEIVGCFKRM